MNSSRFDDHSHRHMSTNDKHKLRQNEKYEKNYRQWQQAKAESKQDHYKHLKQKVALQHDLIRAQDELASQRREKEQQTMSQKREALKASKHAREETLLNICRQSLDDDRRRYIAGRHSQANSRDQKAKSKSPDSSSPVSCANSIMQVMEQRRLGRKPEESVTTLPYQRHTLSPCLGEDEEDEKTDRVALAKGHTLPWHHAQLYRLYGDKANYFLYPKIEPKPQKQLHPKLRNPGGGGAEVLWAGLRNESMSRLRRYDRNVSKDLKVPDLPRLLDKTLLHQAYSLRHKLQLMHRSSMTNADRTRVLTFNNPFPDLNNLDGEDSIDRYLPSWMDSDTIMSEPEYKRWLAGRQHKVESQDVAIHGEPSGSLLDDELFSSRSKPQYLEYPKLKFLKYEKDSDVVAEAHKLRKDRKTENEALKPSCPHSEDTTQRTSSGKQQDDHGVSNGSKYTSSWEPLSMTALVEYTELLETGGMGPFQHGQTKMWQTPVTT
ncbi:uncharacterized protein LOC135470528 isoform X2 [Liolophura sinensis]|uniref:uncharacterized protein LOC135470528 isoform X2 n=1 Tax=Liolophura sinensis TaxID=3198878 RepID=UPI003158F655